MKALLSKPDQDLYSFIRQAIITKGKQPVYREMINVIKKTSLRSVTLALERLVVAGLITLDKSKISLSSTNLNSGLINTSDIPLVPNYTDKNHLYYETEPITTVPISSDLLDPYDAYFLIRIDTNDVDLAQIKGKNANLGDIALVKITKPKIQEKLVVALINGKAVIRGYVLQNKKAFLYPISSDQSINTIVASDNIEIQGVVQDIYPGYLFKHDGMPIGCR
ncbi:MAG: hypothetical protein IT245_07020 [Bacteroidia bacterium]|nr:hypothetical protein [Bacteroidia bacterium]